MNSKLIRSLLFVLVLTGTYPAFNNAFAQEAQKGPVTEIFQQERFSEEIVPGPKDLKEKIGTIVFIIWLWITIIVLVFFLIQKIKEADRLHEFGFFHSQKGKKFIKNR